MPAPTLAPRPPTPQTPLGVKNGSQSVKVQLKPVGTEDDASVPIYEWTFSVGGSETEVELDYLPAGVYTVRAFPVASGRWLRTEGKLIMEVPWVFAVPTGASKVTVYWDGVPGATGYRVRWGVQSGVHPNASGVLSGGVRRYTVDGLVSEQAYYVVVEAEYNGVFGASSEEDSAVPHAGAIPWNTEDPNQIIPVQRSKGLEMKIKVWSATFDDPAYDEPRLLYDFYGCADVDSPTEGVVVRRVVSLAQIKNHTGNDGYRRTGSFFRRVGVGYQPLFDIGDLWTSAQVYCPPWYRLWTPDISAPTINFPSSGGVVNVNELAPYFREIIDINL